MTKRPRIGERVEIIETATPKQYKWNKGIIVAIDDEGQLYGTWGICALNPYEDKLIIRKSYNYPLKDWNLLRDNQKKSRLINVLQNSFISFFFVCGQTLKNIYFDKVRTTTDYDSLRMEMYNVYLENLRKNIYSGDVKRKVQTIRKILGIKEKK